MKTLDAERQADYLRSELVRERGRAERERELRKGIVRTSLAALLLWILVDEVARMSCVFFPLITKHVVQTGSVS